MRKIIIFTLFLTILFLLDFSNLNKRAEAIFFDVGQGDSFVLKTPGGKIILVDGGPSRETLYYLGKYLGFYKRQIDIVILTHGHSDHISALPEIINRYQVKKVFLPLRLSGFSGQALFSALERREVDAEILLNKRCLDLEDNCSLCIFPPGENFKKGEDYNDLSLVIHFDCLGLSLAAAGDASKKRERELLEDNFNWDSLILKVSHHGSNSASSPEFINAVSPLWSVISVGENSYGLPKQEVIDILLEANSHVWRIDKDTSVKFFFNEKNLYQQALNW